MLLHLKSQILMIITLAVSLPTISFALSQHDQTEIDHLIDTIETSSCVFIRNDRRYHADTAADHLRLKLKRGARYISNSEEFIDRLASKSSWSGKDYFIECPNQTRVTSGQWLHAQLKKFRGQANR